MAIAGLDIARFESDQGVSKIEILPKVGGSEDDNPTVSPVVYETGFDTPKIVGNADGYDVSSGNAIRIFYDVKMNGAGFVKIRLLSIAANIVQGNEPAPVGNNPDFPHRVQSLTAVGGPIRPADATIEITADDRGSILIFRAGPAIKVQVESDDVAAEGAFAIQNQQGRE